MPQVTPSIAASPVFAPLPVGLPFAGVMLAPDPKYIIISSHEGKGTGMQSDNSN